MRARTVAASSAGFLAGDALATLLLLPFIVSFDPVGGDESAGNAGLALAGTATAVFVSPALGVYGARRAGERGDAGGRAYLAACGVRVATILAAGALLGWVGDPNDQKRVLAVGVVLAGDLVLAPYVVARVLAGAPEIAAPEPEAAPAR